YQVLRLLGAGGMGVVYATKRRNESLAAVKVLHPRFAKDKSIRARFLEEGYLANRVGHPAVVTILEDDIDEEGNFYIVMELLDGVDLGKFVGPPRLAMSTAQVLNIADQLLTALVQAHQKGIVHRDIKPSNVMILRDGRVKLLDFGIAKALGADGTASAREDDDEEEVVGTDRYMSPEQGNGFFEDIDARSDLWSVGALMMALLAEPDDSSVPLWDQSYEDRAWSFSRLGQDVPPHVVQIISLALQPQKTKRWVSAAAMREAVRAAHVDLYGPITSEPLAVLARAQLSSPSEAASAISAEEAPKTRIIVEPPVTDPTVPSRPSQPPPSPRVTRRAEAFAVVHESPVPP
ncbi:MAG TPA: serine/threonine-protein kinase, partial [Polyangiaceae bacterium]|nr:serine/threonine-protein kinase [Polyangiaceae bacterium]